MNYLKNLLKRNQPGIGIELGPERINIAEIRQKGNKCIRSVNWGKKRKSTGSVVE